MHASTPRLNRRDFLRRTAALAAAPSIVPAAVLGAERAAPSERVNVGVIGVGSRGFNLLAEFIQQPDVQIVALCDVDKKHYRDRQWGQGKENGLDPACGFVRRHYADTRGRGAFEGVAAYGDYRALCAHEGLDAVVVATPDHWHALCTLEALGRGADVYCEKPVTHRFQEGLVVCREAARRKAVFQTGCQQRSTAAFRHAVELVRNGCLGAISRIEVGLPPGYEKPMGDDAVTEPPDHLDYAMWCGPAPMLPYMRARSHRWWRGHLAYGGGVLMDWIGHHNDIAQWSLDMDRSGPERIEAIDWIPCPSPVYNTPWQYTVECRYPGGVTVSISSRHKQGTKWTGEDGWLHVCRKETTASDTRWLEPSFDPGPVRMYQSPGHVRNFLDCVRSREACVAPAETAHRAITPGHVGYVSHALGRALDWDAARQEAVNDDEANRLLRAVDYRAPWTFEG